METANFFWHGNPLSLYEQLCISSFVKHGFEVNVWSFMDLKIPEGATLRDAKEIISQDHLYKYTQAGKPGNIAAFSDVFRFTLMFKKPGEWWFDTDSICLKDSIEYNELKLNKKIVLAYEDENKNSSGIGALTIPDQVVAQEILNEQSEICATITDIPWGIIGPRLATNYCIKNNMEDQILSVKVFYPIGYHEWDHIYDTSLTETLLNKIKDSHMTHLWNEILGSQKDKNEIPPKDSFLHIMFEKYLPEVLKKV
jgi:hypothetical protein